MNGKYLGKIENVYFGLGGYQGAMLGLHLYFSFNSCQTGNSIATWDPETIECSGYSQWTEQDRDKNFANICRKISLYLSQAKKRDVSQLEGVPVELEFEDNILKSWRILTEVI